MKNPFNKTSGFTLTELMIAIALNLLVLIALVSIFVTNLQHYRSVLNTNRLQQELQTAMNIMSNDIRRAGYWANARNDLRTDQNNNPFMVSGTDVSVGTGNTCILLTYDRDNNGTLPSVSSSYDDERYGYRLNSQTLQTRPWGASFSCTAAASAWENVTDPNVILITGLTFTLNTQTISTGPGTAAIILRSVDITLSGRLTSDATVTKTLTEHIRIRNDKFQP
jgi:prepilin peptidase dependent protein B